MRPSAVVVWKSSTLVTTSPARRPGGRGGAVGGDGLQRDAGGGREVGVGAPPTVTPKAALTDFPFAMSSPATRTATSDGMAKPMPMLPDWLPLPEPEPVLAIEELMPTTDR